ncbi:MAG: McrB family protein [Ectobacillus sp.]
MLKQWGFCLLGTIASNHDVEVEFGKSKSVFINSQNTVQFWIRRVSTKPEHFPDQSFFTCYATELEKFGFEDKLTEPDYMREEKLRKFLENYLIVFLPAKKVTPSNDIYLAKEIMLLRKADSFQSKHVFIPVPIYSEKEHGYSFMEFCKRIAAKKHIGKIEKISTDSSDTPSFIFWKENESTVYALGPFSSHSYAHGGFCFSAAEPAKAHVVPEEWLDEMYEASVSLAFLDAYIYDSLHMLMQGEDARKLEEILCIEGKQEAAAAAEPIAAQHPVLIQENHRKCHDEERFLEHFIHVTKENGLLYSEKDIVNFHTAMKVSKLVILQGMSGIGKSRLIHAYAKALGIHNNEQMLIIPVKPSWTDDTDIIGYADLLHMIYRPSDSGLIDLLIEASKEENRDSKLYIVAFDEMNLARVEHYFSQFLSVLEMQENRRVLRLYNDNLESKLYNAAQYPPTVMIGDNVMFVGTVNVDESTYHFSDKVLDRANVITLEVLKYSLLARYKDGQRDWGYMEQEINYQTYRAFQHTDAALQLSEAETDLLWDIHQALQAVDHKAGIGPRIVKQIDLYLKNLPSNPYLSREDALDLQLVQRVLTKIRGSEDVWRYFIGMYDAEKDDVVSSKLIHILHQYRALSHFTKTTAAIKQKAKELKFNGYTY